MTDNPLKDTASMTDAEIIEQVQARQSWAFAELYDRYAPRLYGLVLRMLKDESHASDALQDVFLLIWRNIRHFDNSRGSSLAWMMAVARNHCIDRLRALQKNKERFVEFDEQDFQLQEPAALAGPYAEASYKNLRQSVINALRQLPGEQRQVIELAYFEGLAQSELSRKLDLPLGTVKSRIRLGIQKLRDIFSDA